MREFASDIAFTPAVKAIQNETGSRSAYEKMERGTGWQTKVTPDLKQFLEEQDMFYLGTANANGHPYIQYRGGPVGLLKVLDETTLGFADFGGNRQFITAGNLSENPKAFIFLMDYLNRRRIKLWGNARVIEGDRELIEQLEDPDYPGRTERAILFEIAAWDVNCPQHIHRRVPVEYVDARIQRMQSRITDLEARLEAYGATADTKALRAGSDIQEM